jgi:hypothetical protein
MLALKKTAVLLALLTGTFLLTACPSQTSIAKINAGTGRIWVATTRGIPSKGARVGAKGYVHNGFSFGGRTYGTVMEETDRRSRSK